MYGKVSIGKNKRGKEEFIYLADKQGNLLDFASRSEMRRAAFMQYGDDLNVVEEASNGNGSDIRTGHEELRTETPSQQASRDSVAGHDAPPKNTPPNSLPTSATQRRPRRATSIPPKGGVPQITGPRPGRNASDHHETGQEG